MGTVPRIGNFDRDRREELAQPLSGFETLGTIANPSAITDPQPKSVSWTREDGVTIEITEPPAPWETADEKFTASDARRFVEAPPQWRLHWVNPRLLESEGWRDWQAVSASDERVKVRVKSMVTPENYIRRGGPTGDILCWMWQGHHDVVKRKQREKTAILTQQAAEKQETLREEFARGTFGPHMRITGATSPTHTQAEGRSMRD